MQISKSLLVIWATLLCAGLQLVCAAETDAQAKAREALRKKMEELQPGSAETVVPAPAVVPQESPAPKPPKRIAKPAPAPVIVPPPSTPEVVVTPPADSEAVARSREALRKKMQELQSTPPTQTQVPVAPAPEFHAPAQPTHKPAPAPQVRTTPAPAPVIVPPPATSPAPAPVVAPPPVVAAPQPPVVREPQTPPPTAPPVVAQPQTPAPAPGERQEAVQAAEDQSKTKPTTSKAPPKTKVAPTHTFRPIEGPPPNISAEKQQSLRDLLRRYQADEIT